MPLASTSAAISRELPAGEMGEAKTVRAEANKTMANVGNFIVNG